MKLWVLCVFGAFVSCSTMCAPSSSDVVAVVTPVIDQATADQLMQDAEIDRLRDVFQDLDGSAFGAK